MSRDIALKFKRRINKSMQYLATFTFKKKHGKSKGLASEVS